VQDLPQPLPADPHPPVGVTGQVLGQLADAPSRERSPELGRTRPSHRHDVLDVGVADPAGTAARPARVQRGKPPLVERVDHLTHRVLVRLNQPGDRRYLRPGRRRHGDHRPAHPDRLVLAPPHDLLQPATLVLGQPPRPHRPGHQHHPILEAICSLSRMGLANPGATDIDRRVTTPGERSW
jgi:hypothetical protein